MLKNKITRNQFRRGHGFPTGNIHEVYKHFSMKRKQKSLGKIRVKNPQEIYSSRKRNQNQKEKQEKVEVLSRKDLKTASVGVGGRYKTSQQPQKKEQKLQDINLYVSEGKRRIVYDDIMDKNKSMSKEMRLTRAKSARTVYCSTDMKGMGFKRSQTHRYQENALDAEASRALNSKLKIPHGQLYKKSDGVAPRKRQKIIIFEKGIMLRNKF